MGKCNHKDKHGESLIEDFICKRCGVEFGTKYIKKQKEIYKKTKYKENWGEEKCF